MASVMNEAATTEGGQTSEKKGILQVVTEEVTKDAKIVTNGVKTGVEKASELVKPATTTDEPAAATDESVGGETAQNKGILQVVTEEVTKDAKIVTNGVATGVTMATEIVKPATTTDEPATTTDESVSTVI